MKPRSSLKKQMAVLTLAFNIAVAPVVCNAKNIPGFYGGVGNLVPPAVNTLPQVQNIVQGVSGLEQVGDNRMVVHQDQKKAVVEWQSFDIGANAWVHFDQTQTEIDPETGEPIIVPQTNWSALNRIYDQNPSQIFGRLSADGEVYLINQNGMLFSPGAQVDVHGLVASSLNIATQDFTNDLMTFAAENYQQTDSYDASAVAVSNHGSIRTDDNGAVMLIGPTVENSGAIEVPLGRIVLASGTDVRMEEDIQGAQITFVVNAGGESTAAVNYPSGSMSADLGQVGMYGRVVNQEGLIRAVTAIRKNGKIELKASEELRLGAASLTESPISTSEETLVTATAFNGGELTFDSGGRIDIAGTVTAPSGEVSANAADRIYLDAQSRIDVSGSWVALPAEAALAGAQLNSVELKDDHAQKQGILQGENITFNTIEGTGIGDISGTLTAEEKTALERSTQGGEIYLQVGSGEVIARSGAEIDFSGGGVLYGDGVADTTVLVAGNRLYSIADAPASMVYDAIIGPDHPVTTSSQRFGMSEAHEGIYHTGAANSVGNRCAGYTEGDDAGLLEIKAPVVVLNAALDGSVVEGVYQTEAAESQDEYGYQTTLGIHRPLAGRLLVGASYSADYWEDRDPIVREIALAADPALLPDGFEASSDLPDAWSNASPLSAGILNDAGLSQIQLSVRERVTVDETAVVQMAPGSSLTLAGRHIEQHGTITIPAGEVNLILSSNLTFDAANAAYIDSADLGYERIVLAEGSRIDVSGERVDLSRAVLVNGSLPDPGLIDGGAVVLEDRTVAGEGVIVMPGAAVDAGGGWRIDAAGSVTGGDAGTLQMAGPNLILQGDLRAHALADAAGGNLALHAEAITVAETLPAPLLVGDFGPDDPLPAAADGQLFLSPDQIDATGATSIELKSITDIVVGEGVSLTPSTLKRLGPELGAKDTNGDLPNHVAQTAASGAIGKDLYRVGIDWVDSGTIRLVAGKTLGGDKTLPDRLAEANTKAAVIVGPLAEIRTAPGGTIRLSGPSLDIGGRIRAPAGTVDLATTSGLAGMALILRSGAAVEASAYHPPLACMATTGLPFGYDPLDGGRITLSSASDVVVEVDAVLDVSGSQPVNGLRLNPDGSYQQETVAGNPGEIQIAFLDQLLLEGRLDGKATRADMHGGTLVLRKTDLSTPYELNSRDIDTFLQSGFDDITLASNHELCFAQSVDARVGRKLTLDAPAIAANGQSIHLRAPWISLTNTFEPANVSPVRTVGDLHLAADWIDISGDFVLSGFDSVGFNAARDIRFADVFYDYPTLPDEWSGQMQTQADLLFNADRVYPQTQAIFSIVTEGEVTTMAAVAGPSANPVYSAGGKLTLEADGILHRGRWLAPMGQLAFTATGDAGRIYLEEGSLLSTSGDTRVNYGGLDADAILWLAIDKDASSRSPSVEFQEALDTGIQLAGHEIVARGDALVDISGGGTVFGYQFLPGTEGSTHPLRKAGRYVVVPDMADALPGEAIYLEGNGLLEEGFYSLMPEAYAFADGALILEDLGSAVTTDGNASLSEEGYAVIAGHTVVADTAFRTDETHYYTVRPAEAVLAEGNFTLREMTAGDAGSFGTQADTTILNATLDASPLDGFSGGSLSLSSRTITASASGVRLPDGFFYRSPIPDDLRDQLIIDADAITAGGFDQVTLGNAVDTVQVAVEAGSTLAAANITIAAADAIQLGAGSRLAATGGDAGGALRLVSAAGRVTAEPAVHLQADHDIHIDTHDLLFSDDVSVNTPALELVGNRIDFDFSGANGGPTEALVIDETLWTKFQMIDSVNLASRSVIRFHGDVDLQAAGALILDADRIQLDPVAAGQVGIRAGSVQLRNTSLSGEGFVEAGIASQSATGSMSIAAGSFFLTFGAMTDTDAAAGATNDLVIDGMAAVGLHVDHDVVVAGEGALRCAGNLDITSAGITTAVIETIDSNGNTAVQAAKVSLLSPAGTIATHFNGSPVGEAVGYGGSIALEALSLDIGGVIASPSGAVSLRASGGNADNGVFLRDGSRIEAQGGDAAPGGTVRLTADFGSVEIAGDAEVNVSAGAQGDAGSLSVAAPNGDVRISGTLDGRAAAGGTAGSFSLDAGTMDAVDAMLTRLASGGFHGDIDLRARQGDLVIGTDEAFSAASVHLAADAGGVTLNGTLAGATQEGGGTLEIYAAEDIHLTSGSLLDAGTAVSGGDGGRILLASASGTIRFDNNARMDTGGGKAGGKDGSIQLRALRDGDSLRMDLGGTIEGATAVYAEGVAVFDGIGILNSSAGADTDGVASMDDLVAAAAAWLESLTFQHGLQGIDAGTLAVVPGIEVRSDADLTIGQAIDFSDYAADVPVGFLTLRSSGDLVVNQGIVDAPSEVVSLREDTAQRSWGLNLVAGADTGSSDFLAVSTTAGGAGGDLALGDGALIYTENAPVRFASAGDTTLGTPGATDPMTLKAMKYNIGSFSGSVSGHTAGDLIAQSGGLQTATGDIRLTIGGDLVLRGIGQMGAIRTIGEAPDAAAQPQLSPTERLSLFWEYQQGGDIAIDVGGNIDGVPTKQDAWDDSVGGQFYFPQYEGGGIKGIVTMAGGHLDIRAGGDVTCAAGAFGRGDPDATALTIVSRGSLNGRFLIGDGRLRLTTFENFGTLKNFNNQPIEAFDAQIALTAQGRLQLGTILNPTIANVDLLSFWDLGYSEDSAVELRSVRSDVVIEGQTQFYTDKLERSRVLPATLSIEAAGDIVIGNNFYLAPSSTGNLVLTAGGDIRSVDDPDAIQPKKILAMSDADPSLVYGIVNDSVDYDPFQLITDTYAHDPEVLHATDDFPASFHADGDIHDLLLFVPKAAAMTAGNDVADIYYHGQNLNGEDLTYIHAANDIRFSSGIGSDYQTGIEIGGPGAIVVAAGNAIDLGTTKGIQAVGTLYNTTLPRADGQLAVYSGIGPDAVGPAVIPELKTMLKDTILFFSQIQEEGEVYSQKLAEGDLDAAQAVLAQIDADTIDPFFSDKVMGDGDINMVNSQIYTSGNAGDIYILAAGEFNVGKSTFRKSGDAGDNSGIYTTAGGEIFIFAEGDVNVNESRLMTFMSGDITAWTQEGNINAGRGSKTAISVTAPTVSEDKKTGEIEITFTPPPVGSGVRALTFDPDGLEGPREQPEPGDIYLFAPKGEIDAGEAGIAGKNIILAATKVVNVQNIEVSGTSVGVPDTGMAATSIGALAGSGTVSETSKVAEEQAGLGGAKERFSKYVEDLAENLVPKWIAVEVIGFGEDEEEEEK